MSELTRCLELERRNYGERRGQMRYLLFPLMVLATPAMSEVVTPSDPYLADAAIVTLYLDQDDNRHWVVVGVANRTERPFDANYSCTLADAEGFAAGEASGVARAVPPQQMIISNSVIFAANVESADCRIEFTTPL